ncbi:chemotaxis protein CheB [Sphingomicrobium flavum]|uniref:chemotaxis protein CheB n=1 Tax=Sphingomicrobium flavum TaxID=1229164 RepID=UPI0021AD96A2|nr:chemotaxis protein CheB [Sphingomicrobium flavum]
MGDSHEELAPASTREEEGRIPIVGIGASAGGLEALREMLGAANGPTGMAFVIIQHLDPNHNSLMDQLLARETSLNVAQVKGGELPLPDHVYIIPPGHNLALIDGQLQLRDFERPRGMRRPIDDFFETLAEDHETQAACVIMSGTGADGAVGLRAIKEHGGIAIAQEPTSARYDGMPLAAVATGQIDFICEPAEIISTLHDYFSRRLGADGIGEEAAKVAHNIDQLCEVLRNAVGHDFSGYKRSTLERRIERRMQVLGIEKGDHYLARIRKDQDECENLFRDLLINVTRFFRDREYFEVLRDEVIAPLVADHRESDEELRIWIPGCSSGEEAYTIAMIVADEMREAKADFPVQIFATDIDEQMLNLAREANYPPAALVDMPSRYRDRYIETRGDHVSVSPAVRDMVRVSNHSIIKDAPFSRLDLVCCRNLLIYFGDRLQQSVIPLLHYSILDGGYLMLGPSESIGRFDNLFEPVDHKAKIFRRLPGRAHYPVELQAAAPRRKRQVPATASARRQAVDWSVNVGLKRLIDRYAPASMVLDHDGEILASYGRLSRYFEFPATRVGKVSAAALARPGLREVMLPLLRQIRSERVRTAVRDVEVKSEFGIQKINIIADPLPDEQILIVLRETAEFQAVLDEDMVEMGPNDGQVELLEDELRLARHRLRCTVEELETVNEELKSSNEEMMSMNEELQSTNEELTTVNDELKSKVDQLTVANADLKNFFDSTQLAVVVLDSNLAVRSFTEAATSIFPLKPGDRGRGLDEMTSFLTDEQYLDDARTIITGGLAVERKATTRDGRILLYRVMPYRVMDGSVSGATLVFTDITKAAALEVELANERERLKLALEVSGIGVWEYFVEEDRAVLDGRAERLFFLESAASHDVGQIMNEIDGEDRKKVDMELRRAISGEADYDTTFRVNSGEGQQRVLRGLGRVVQGSKPTRLIGVNFDITSEVETLAMRELMLREMNHRVKNLFAIIGGMVSLAAREETDPERMAHTLRDRIAALGRAHSLSTSKDSDEGSDLGALVKAALSPYDDHPSVSLEGDAVAIVPSCVSSLALIFHEWATNSVKYGALGDQTAQLSVRWTDQDDGGALIDWSEEFSQARNSVKGEGFGSTLVAASAKQLGARVEQHGDERGFRLTLNLPPNCRMPKAVESSS